MKISAKLPIVIVVLAILSAVLTGIISFVQSEQALEDSAFNSLVAVKVGRVHELTGYLDSIRQDVQTLADNHMTIDALEAFENGWDEIAKSGKDVTAELQRLYIKENPNAVGEKHKLDAAPDGSAYSKAHAKYHPWFRAFLEEREYYDVFLVNHEGKVAYSVYKELDFATDVLKGKYKDSDLGKVARDISANFKKGTIAFSDFAPYEPSGGAAASFIASPIFDHEGKKHGFLVFQMPISNINDIMQSKAGLGETGEAYLVGKDFLMRSDSRYSKESTILKTKAETEAVKKALLGESGVMLGIDYLGTQVLSAYEIIDFLGVKWATLVEIDLAEVKEPVIAMGIQLAIVTLAVALVIAIIGFFFAKSISSPINSMNVAMGELSSGALETEIPGMDRGDEIGDMAGAVQVFKENAIKVRQMTREQEQTARRNQRKVASEIASLNNAMKDEIEGAVTSVITQSKQMQQSSQGLAELASSSSEMSSSVATASEEATANVQTVAAAAEELTSSIGEISQQVLTSSEIAGRAVIDADETNEKIQGLAEAAGKIGDVVNLINDIAEQTNLLALNATIEAARAGDAGKGFAVVASEVKNLANQTAKATEEISSQVGGMQAATNESVTAIDGISGIIRDIDSIANSIASAVEEQGAATNEIARNVDEASTGTQEVSTLIADVNKASMEAKRGAEEELEMVSSVREGIQGMYDRLVALIESSQDKHLSERFTVNLACKVTTSDGKEYAALLQEISRVGAVVFDGGTFPVESGTTFKLEQPKLGNLEGRTLAANDKAIHAFIEVDDQSLEAIEKIIG
ncbi:MAG: methyl-accepting chemotaxis protein [Alphaproteobacteria bacterium]|nr:methyl-accepting chemotaxis protein [Alphaproteobacteria bacterium]